MRGACVVVASMNSILAPYQALVDYERSFDGQVWIDFTREHAEVPILAVAAYLVVVFYVPDVLRERKPFNLKSAFALWNLFLAIFSTIGMPPHAALVRRSRRTDA